MKKILATSLCLTLIGCSPTMVGFNPGSRGWVEFAPDEEIREYFSGSTQFELCRAYQTWLDNRYQGYIEDELASRGQDRYACYDQNAEQMRQVNRNLRNIQIQQMLNNNTSSKSSRSYTDRQIDAMRHGTVDIPTY